jgi:hypothetical protein
MCVQRLIYLESFDLANDLAFGKIIRKLYIKHIVGWMGGIDKRE